jgi:hypothetical protein
MTRLSRLFLTVCCLSTSGSLVVAQTAAHEQAGLPATGGPRVMEFTSPSVRFWLAQAIEGAARRLRRPGCRRVFSDFKDPSGNLLETNLIRLAVHPADYLLKFVWFADGSDKSQCNARTAAFTEPGSRVVFVCRRYFEQRSRGSELEIIHEILHSLGLGENPPSSDTIARQVAARCWGDDRPHPLTDSSQPRRRGSGRTETYDPSSPPSLHRPRASTEGRIREDSNKHGVQFWTDCSLIGKVDELGCARLNHSRVLGRPQLWLMPMQPNAMADTPRAPKRLSYVGLAVPRSSGQRSRESALVGCCGKWRPSHAIAATRRPPMPIRHEEIAWNARQTRDVRRPTYPAV